MSTDETNTQLWSDAQRQFQRLLVDSINDSDAAEEARKVRHATILEIAAIIEAARHDPVRLADPDDYIGDVLDMLLEQVTGLLTTELDQK